MQGRENPSEEVSVHPCVQSSRPVHARAGALRLQGSKCCDKSCRQVPGRFCLGAENTCFRRQGQSGVQRVPNQSRGSAVHANNNHYGAAHESGVDGISFTGCTCRAGHQGRHRHPEKKKRLFQALPAQIEKLSTSRASFSASAPQGRRQRVVLPTTLPKPSSRTLAEARLW